MLRPTQDYIVIKPLERILSRALVVSNSEKHCRGLILAVGPGKRDKRGVIKPLDAQVGQTVIFGNGEFDFYPKFLDHKPDGTTDVYRVIQEADICGICEEKQDVVDDKLTSACACIGPENGQTLCPCALRRQSAQDADIVEIITKESLKIAARELAA